MNLKSLFRSQSLAAVLPLLSLVLIAVTDVRPCIAGAFFVPNFGQTDKEVAFYGSAGSASIFFTPGAIVIDLNEPAGMAFPPKGSSDPLDAAALRRRGSAVFLRFEDGARAARIEGRGARPERLSFFLGEDPTGWHPGVRPFEEVVYRGLLPGTDVAFREEGGRLRYRLESSGAAAGTELARLRLGVDGPPRIEVLEGDGEGVIAWDAPAAGERDTWGSPTASGERDDPSMLSWASYLGGSGDEIAWGSAVDGEGNVIVTGLTASTFFPTTPGAYDVSYNGFGDVFVSKLAADGGSLLWSTFLGGTATGWDYGYAVDLDPQGNPVVTGYTYSSDFPTTPGAYDRSHNGVTDAFVSKLDGATGSALLWSTFLGGMDIDIAYSVTVSAEGEVAVCGRTLSFDLPATPGAYDTFANGEEDAFVAKFDAAGASLLWCTYLGGSLFDAAQAIATGPFEDLLLAGHTSSGDFPTEGQEYAGGLYDVFVAKLSASGSALLWSRYFGGTEYEFGNALALDESGNPIVAGATGSADLPVSPGSYDDSYNGNEDAYVAKFDGLSGAPIWATFLGGTEGAYETIFGVETDPLGRVILAGSTPSSDFPTTPDAYDTSWNGANDGFVARLDATGSELQWSSFLGGSANDYIWDTALEPDGTIALAGSTESLDFPATVGAFDEDWNGGDQDAFVARMRAGRDPAAAPEYGPGSVRGVVLHPNPSGGRAISIDLPSRLTGDQVAVTVVDAVGRVVNRWREEPRGGEPARITWEPHDAFGRPLPAGIYWIAVESQGGRREARLTLLR